MKITNWELASPEKCMFNRKGSWCCEKIGYYRIRTFNPDLPDHLHKASEDVIYLCEVHGKEVFDTFNMKSPE